MKGIKAEFSVSIVCVILGLALAYQFQAVKNIPISASGRDIEELSSKLSIAKREKDMLEDDIRRLEGDIESYEREAADTSIIGNSLKSELDRIRIFAGVTDVSGAGIKITISPLSKNLDNSELASVRFVHLISIINELNSFGAEAIMINNQRIVTATQIREAGNTMVINDVRYSKLDKFEIYAIGDPETLETAVSMTGGIRELLYMDGIGLTVDKSDNITVFKYNKTMEFRFMQPAQ